MGTLFHRAIALVLIPALASLDPSSPLPGSREEVSDAFPEGRQSIDESTKSSKLTSSMSSGLSDNEAAAVLRSRCSEGRAMSSIEKRRCRLAECMDCSALSLSAHTESHRLCGTDSPLIVPVCACPSGQDLCFERDCAERKERALLGGHLSRLCAWHWKTVGSCP